MTSQAQRILSDIEIDRASEGLFGEHELVVFHADRSRFLVDVKKDWGGTGNSFCSPEGIGSSFDLGHLDGGHVFGVMIDSGNARARETKLPDLVAKLEWQLSEELGLWFGVLGLVQSLQGKRQSSRIGFDFLCRCLFEDGFLSIDLRA